MANRVVQAMTPARAGTIVSALGRDGRVPRRTNGVSPKRSSCRVKSMVTPMKQNTIKASTPSTPEPVHYRVLNDVLTTSRVDSGRRLARRFACLCLAATIALAPSRYARADAARHDVLYIASTGDNEVFAVPDAGDRPTPPPGGRSKGTVIYADDVHLHGALAMAEAPNGHLLVSNSDGINADPNQPSEIVEFTISGQFIGEIAVDAAPGGAFGLSLVRFNDDQVRFAAVDDNANVLKLMTVKVPDSPPTY
jgi:hypothetical protein